MGRWRDVARGFPRRLSFFSSSPEDRANKRHEAPATPVRGSGGLFVEFSSDDTPAPNSSSIVLRGCRFQLPLLSTVSDQSTSISYPSSFPPDFNV